jgi:ribosomal protein L4
MVAATKPVRASVPAKITIGVIIDKLWQIREDKKEIAKAEAEANAKIAALETLLYERMDKEDSTKGAGKYASVSLGTQDVVQFTPESGYDDFIKYVAKSKNYHLLERRISQLAAQEVIKLKGKLPGTQVFTKRKINLTTTPSK